MMVLGFFSGISFPAVGNAALHEVTGQDSSLASGVQSAMQQVGGALGLSCLVTLGTASRRGQVGHGVNAAVATSRLRVGVADRRGLADHRRRARARVARAGAGDAAQPGGELVAQPASPVPVQA